MTGGLADNCCWRLGIFYLNREDLSILVERRSGLGYSLNFGNRRGVVLLFPRLRVILFRARNQDPLLAGIPGAPGPW